MNYDGIGQLANIPCVHPGCQSGTEVRWESSRTMYHWDGTGEDPNAPLALCRECAEEHHLNWDYTWAEYYSGLL